MDFYVNLEKLPFRPTTPTILIQNKQIIDDKVTLVTLEKNLKNQSFKTLQKPSLVALSGSNIILIKTQTSPERSSYNKKLEPYVRPYLKRLEEAKKLESQLEAALSVPRGGNDSLIGKIDLSTTNPGVTASPFKSKVS